jgi:hypothetical protein
MTNKTDADADADATTNLEEMADVWTSRITLPGAQVYVPGATLGEDGVVVTAWVTYPMPHLEGEGDADVVGGRGVAYAVLLATSKPRDIAPVTMRYAYRQPEINGLLGVAPSKAQEWLSEASDDVARHLVGPDGPKPSEGYVVMFLAVCEPHGDAKGKMAEATWMYHAHTDHPDSIWPAARGLLEAAFNLDVGDAF